MERKRRGLATVDQPATYRGFGINAADRVCRLCKNRFPKTPPPLEGEQHFLIDCPSFAALRIPMFQLIIAHNPNLLVAERFAAIMQQPDVRIVKALVSFL